MRENEGAIVSFGNCQYGEIFAPSAMAGMTMKRKLTVVGLEQARDDGNAVDAARTSSPSRSMANP
jgi:hypothetical protein